MGLKFSADLLLGGEERGMDYSTGITTSDFSAETTACCKEATYDHHSSKQGIKVIPIHTRLTANTVPTIKPYPLVNLFNPDDN